MKLLTNLFRMSLILLLSGSMVMAQKTVPNDPAGKATPAQQTGVNLKAGVPGADFSATAFQNSLSGSKALFDLQFNLALPFPRGTGIETDGNYFYVGRWNASYFYRFDLTGALVDSFAITGVANLRDLAYDGQYFYGSAANNQIFQMDFTAHTLVSTITGPTGLAVRHIAYDPINDAFWCGDWDDDFRLISKTGTVLQTIPATTHLQADCYGSAYDNFTPGGPYLWLYKQSNNGNDLAQVNLSTGAPTGTTFDITSVVTTTGIAGGLCVGVDVVSGFASLIGLVQNERIWGVELKSLQFYPNDVAPVAFLNPVSSNTLTSSEDVIVRIMNNDTVDHSDIPVSYVIDGGMPVDDTVFATVAAGTYVDFTFNQQADFSMAGHTYNVMVYTALAADSNAMNDTLNAVVNNLYGVYCNADGGCDEYIGEFFLGDISNISATCSNYGDYTAMEDTLWYNVPEVLEAVAYTYYAGDVMGLWIDWNQDGDFLDADETVAITNPAGDSIFMASVTAPNHALPGPTRLRVRLQYNGVPAPCGTQAYGEVEDYTVIVAGTAVDYDAASISIDVNSVIIPQTFNPQATVKNLGSQPVVFNVTMNITGGYTSTQSVSLNPGNSQQVTFDPYVAVVGNYDIEVYTSLALDVDNTNDTITQTLDVQEAIKAYCYVAYDPTSVLPEGPAWTYLQIPGTVTSLADQSGQQFIGAGTWGYPNVWYGAVYGDNTLVKIDTLTGARTVVGNLGVSMTGLAYDYSTSTLYGMDYGTASSLYTINTVNGAITLVGNSSSDLLINLACDINGNLFALNTADDQLYSINKLTGAATAIGPIGFDAAYAQDMEFDLNNDILYMAAYNATSGSGELRIVDPTTGATTLIGPFQNGAEITGFAIPYIVPVSDNDAAMVSVNGIASECGLGSAEVVEVTIANAGAANITTLNVAFSVDGGTAVVEPVTTTIAPGATYNYTFTATADLSAAGAHSIKAWVALAGDTLQANDTVVLNVINVSPVGVPYSMGFESTEDLSGWVVENTNGDASTWVLASTGGNAGPACMTYSYNMAAAANDWVISTCINFEAGKTYQLSFYYKAQSASYPEKMSVWIGSDNVSTALTTQITDLPNINQTSYQMQTVNFTVPSTGVYYIGFKCYSLADMWLLFLDDINITEVSAINEASAGFEMYPNPAKEVLNVVSTSEVSKVRVTNMLGAVVYESVATGKEIRVNTSSLNAGMYILSLETEQGIISRKFSVQ